MYTFDEIVGQEQIKKSLINAFFTGKISHAYIFSGSALSGKKSIANAFAKMLLCTGEGKKPCCQCISCISFDSFTNPDIIRVVPTKNKSIGVDDVREQIIKQIYIKPYKYTYKIFIINYADTMTHQAQNALLRTIEEPPAYGIFLLTSNNNGNFLDTILSRCILFKLIMLPPDKIANYLFIKKNIPLKQAHIFAAFSQGSLGKAILIASSQFIQIRQHTLNWLSDLNNKNIFDLINIPVEIESLEYKDYLNDILDIVILWYRDILVFKELGNTMSIIQKDITDLIVAASNDISFDKLLKNIDTVFNTKGNIELNANWILSLENMLLNII